jgi:hypothetical protein
MNPSLLCRDQTIDYNTKEAGPIVVALAFVLAMGGAVAAAIILCGWQNIESVGMNLMQRRVEIVCR